jgi:hypothetical protein
MLGGKPAKAEMKQRNLFGQPVVEDPDKGAGAKGKNKPVGKEKNKANPKKKSKSPLPGGGDAAEAKGPETQDTQMEDDSQIMSNFDSQVQDVETQLEETQLDGSSPPVETEAETQTEEGETQLETQMDGDDDEPVSRFARTAPRSHADRWK